MKLLIIEDEKQVADNLKEGLEQHRYNIDVAYNGEDGYYLTQEFDYDIIILDLMLPDIDGEDLCRKLRDDNNQSFILMLTAKKQLDNIVEGLDCGADDYLTKPFEFSELLILSDLEDNSYRTAARIIDIKVSLIKILKLYENQIDSKDLKLIKNIKGRSEILCNQTQIEQLLFNLLDNAVKYSDPGGYLKISMKDDSLQKQILLNITNTSSAINKDDIPHIFKRFYRASSSSDRKSFGLGLSIAKKIVENYGGEIEVNFDQDKKEVTFVVIFPVAKDK